jgi:ElaB/YqjD/DUF883 family membrane-anchored ribosome-binding protein
MLRSVGTWSAVVLAALALVGCAEDDESASEGYANDVCSALGTWVTDVQDTTQSLTDAGLATSREDVEAAVDDIGDSTQTLVDDLEELGAPETEDGQEAREELERLSTQLEAQVDTIRSAVDSGAGAAAVSTVLTALSASADALQAAYDDLRELDPSGELQDAFANADDCDSLQQQVEDLGSDGGN